MSTELSLDQSFGYVKIQLTILSINLTETFSDNVLEICVVFKSYFNYAKFFEYVYHNKDFKTLHANFI